MSLDRGCVESVCYYSFKSARIKAVRAQQRKSATRRQKEKTVLLGGETHPI